jgi:hypothetical protein
MRVEREKELSVLDRDLYKGRKEDRRYTPQESLDRHSPLLAPHTPIAAAHIMNLT